MASYAKTKFRIKTDGKQVICNKILEEPRINLPISVKFNEDKSKLQASVFEGFDEIFDELIADVLLMQTSEKNIDKIFVAFTQLIEKYNYVIGQVIPSDLLQKLSSVLSSAKDYVVDKMKSRNTAKKRQKLIEKDEYYVTPIDCGIGLQWKSKVECGSDLAKHAIEQTCFQYVPMIKTLESIFNNDEFSQSFFDFNRNRKHVCVDNVYEDFCCGSIYRENNVFTPTTIQLQLGIDEFEPCSALKTKSGLHKMCGIYLEIRNIDPKMKSKLGNIYLVALVKSQDLKSGDFEKVVNKIVSDLKILETIGITLKSGVNLKGVLVDISADNLGANGIFGFVECFVATYFCRICELSSAECKTTVEEVADKLRRKSTYNLIVDQLNDDEKADYKETKGIKKRCLFNNLQNFHILNNCTVDVMHDLNEGVIPFFVKFLFERIIQKKIASANELQALCRDHNYGWFWRKYKPSAIKFERSNLNQNAMQSYCLILNLPFILIEFRPKLQPEWRAMECLLQALQIIYSTRIRQSDIDRLRSLLKEHLSFLIEMGLSLLAKHHMTIHYPNLMMRIGPLIHSWMMRYESKHKMFTDMVHLTNNYKNLPFTLAKRHQARICVNKSNAFTIKMNASSSKYDVSKCISFDRYRLVLLPLIENNDKIHGHQFIHYGSMEFRAGLILIEEDAVLEILHVISHNSNYFVLCQKCDVVQFVPHLNSIEIEKSGDSFKLFDIKEIKSHKAHNVIHYNEKKFIIADTLYVYDKF